MGLRVGGERSIDLDPLAGGAPQVRRLVPVKMAAKTKQLVIFGTGEMGALARYYFESDSPYRVCGFTADDAYVSDERFEGLPLVPLSRLTQRFPATDYELFIALSYRRLNRNRRDKFVMAKDARYTLASYVCSNSVRWDDLVIGENCFILENQTIQPGVTIGDNVMIWSGNHLGHGARIGDHAYISSHVVISGHAAIGPLCFIGVNVAVREFVHVGAEAFIAMGAAVTRDVPPGAVVLGASGQMFTAKSREAITLKRKYFGAEW